jgi:hypothetical protein
MLPKYTPVVKIPLPTLRQIGKWLLWLLGATFLGALGSGLWQDALGPLFHFSLRWVLDIASFGFSNYKNDIYLQVAADNQGSVASQTFTWVVMLVYFSLAVGMTSLYVKVVRRLYRAEELLKTISQLSRTPEHSFTPSELKQKLEASVRAAKRGRWLVITMALAAAFCISSLFVRTAKVQYIDSAISHYHQTLHVVSPHLDVHEQLQAESEFAQISTRADYVLLLTRLENEGKKHNLKVPKFDPW